jgi:hypothetical protein
MKNYILPTITPPPSSQNAAMEFARQTRILLEKNANVNKLISNNTNAYLNQLKEFNIDSKKDDNTKREELTLAIQETIDDWKESLKLMESGMITPSTMEFAQRIRNFVEGGQLDTGLRKVLIDNIQSPLGELNTLFKEMLVKLGYKVLPEISFSGLTEEGHKKWGGWKPNMAGGVGIKFDTEQLKAFDLIPEDLRNIISAYKLISGKTMTEAVKILTDLKDIKQEDYYSSSNKEWKANKDLRIIGLLMFAKMLESEAGTFAIPSYIKTEMIKGLTGEKSKIPPSKEQILKNREIFGSRFDNFRVDFLSLLEDQEVDEQKSIEVLGEEVTEKLLESDTMVELKNLAKKGKDTEQLKHRNKMFGKDLVFISNKMTESFIFAAKMLDVLVKSIPIVTKAKDLDVITSKTEEEEKENQEKVEKLIKPELLLNNVVNAFKELLPPNDLDEIKNEIKDTIKSGDNILEKGLKIISDKISDFESSSDINKSKTNEKGAEDE